MSESNPGLGKWFRNAEKMPIPDASAEETTALESEIMNRCSVYYDHIESLSEKRLGALLQRLLGYDLIRGLVPGQIPNRCYKHSVSFNDWEKRLWDRIDLRLETVTDEFFSFSKR